MSEIGRVEETMWSESARSKFASAGADLITAISAQLESFSREGIESRWTEIYDGNVAVERSAVAFSSAQLELTGNSGAFGELVKWDDDDDDDDALGPVSFLSVLQRADYEVLDKEALLEAGRVKFLANRPGETEHNARSVVSHVGAALYELAHANGWNALEKADGLVPLGSIIQAIVPDEAINLGHGLSETDDPDETFSVGGVVIYTEENRFWQ